MKTNPTANRIEDAEDKPKSRRRIKEEYQYPQGQADDEG